MGSKPGAGTSHGICLQCVPGWADIPVEQVDELTSGQLDALPYGIVRLDANDRVIAYNRVEQDLSRRTPNEVLGKSFFTEVAPCTNVRTLAGWVREARAAASDARTSLEFVFEFPFGRAFVELALVYSAASGVTTVFVKQVAQELEP
jgi:photoactive yellow protein